MSASQDENEDSIDSEGEKTLRTLGVFQLVGATAAIAVMLNLGSTSALAQAGRGKGKGAAVSSEPPKPMPRTADGHPDLSGYWRSEPGTKPIGNIGKDLPGFKLPLTPAGEAALKHNLTATIDPESSLHPRWNSPAQCERPSLRSSARRKQSGIPIRLQLLPAHSGERGSKAHRRSRPDVFWRRAGPLGWRHAGDRLHWVQGRKSLDRRECEPA